LTVDALILDFDGVVVDSEPVHLACYQRVLETLGLRLTRQDYYAKYLGYDDHDCLLIAARDAGLVLGEQEIARLTAAKSALVQRAFAESVRPMPGAVELIRSAAASGVPLAICSGALRHEIELALRTVGVLDCFRAMVAAEDVARGKPDPEGYLTARRQLDAVTGRRLAPDRCIVVEDAPAGIRAAKAAGMKVLAVTTSYGAEQLAEADRIVESLAAVTPCRLDEMLG
jgi:beta-phosphoglucomutase